MREPGPDCLFCRIVARTSPAEIEYEDDAVLAFQDIYPKAPVHVLIVPKRHIPSIMALEAGDVDAVGRCLLAARRSTMMSMSLRLPKAFLRNSKLSG